MDYIRSMQLLRLLYAEAGENKPAVAARYKSAFMAGDAYQRLSKLLQTCVFFGAEGAALYAEASDGAIEAVGNISDPAAALARVCLLRDRVESALQRGEQTLCSARLMSSEPAALTAERAKDAIDFCRTFINATCCYLATFYGMNALKNLAFDPSAPPQALLRMLIDRFNEEQLGYHNSDRLPYWRITRILRRGANAISYTGFQIAFDSLDEDEFVRRADEGSMRRLGAYLYVRDDFDAERMEYIGAGNVVGLPIGACAELLSARVVTQAPATLLSSRVKTSDPLDAIASALNTRAFCLSPQLFAEMLDYNALIATIESRRSERACILCGAPTQTGRSTCGTHFRLS